jgi:tRNA(Ile)-lysidine synthase
MERIIRKANEAITFHKMINLRQRIGVAVSGGADSIALLMCLNELKDIWDISLSVLHFNHLIRGKEADEDEEFVEKIAKRFNISFICERYDVRTFAKEKHLNLEAASRIARYRFFEKIKEEYNLDKIALGHTKNDQVENFLIRVLRGSSLKGLASILPVRDFYIRPFIYITREEILNFLKQRNIGYREDKTNYDLHFLRNRIRHVLVPELRRYNKNLIDNISRMCFCLQMDEKLLEKLTKKTFQEVCFFNDGKWFIKRDLVKKDKSLQMRVVCEVVKKLTKSDYSLSFNNIMRIRELLYKKKMVHLRKILKAYVEQEFIVIEKCED